MASRLDPDRVLTESDGPVTFGPLDGAGGPSSDPDGRLQASRAMEDDVLRGRGAPPAQWPQLPREQREDLITPGVRGGTGLDRTRRLSEMILERHPEAFSADYEKNKIALKELALIPSKQLRNHIMLLRAAEVLSSAGTLLKRRTSVSDPE